MYNGKMKAPSFMPLTILNRKMRRLKPPSSLVITIKLHTCSWSISRLQNMARNWWTYTQNLRSIIIDKQPWKTPCSVVILRNSAVIIGIFRYEMVYCWMLAYLIHGNPGSGKTTFISSSKYSTYACNAAFRKEIFPK